MNMASVVAHRSPTKMMHNNMNKSAELKKRKRDEVADSNNRKQKAHKTSPGQSVPAVQTETDVHRIKQRQKQVDFGKNTLGYQIYLNKVPKAQRKREDPRTPEVDRQYSKRCWDAIVRKWRRELHKWDPEGSSAGDENDANAANIDLNDLLDLQQLSDTKEIKSEAKESATKSDKNTVHVPIKSEVVESKKSWADLVDEELNQPSKSIYDDFEDDDF